ncbi:MAG: hypothetical protein JSS63_13000 [Bacteroidetes bacterium]|nr:hypothetical protein [Bacteroidota bacterium]
MSLKDGVCTNCGAKEVYTNKKSKARGERGQLIAGGFNKWMYIDIYLCLNCGKFEEYVNDKDFKDESVKEKIREKWIKV